ncbi:MAG: hypothetical protein QM734_17415 [Cyclobacteriaceae bacterium]
MIGRICFVLLIQICAQGCYYRDLEASQNQLTDEGLQGGKNGTINLVSDFSFTQPLPSMATSDVINFKVGRSFFHTAWITAPASTKAVDGLGPFHTMLIRAIVVTSKMDEAERHFQ